MQNNNCRDPEWWGFFSGSETLRSKLELNLRESPEDTFRWMMACSSRLRDVGMMTHFRDALETHKRSFPPCAEEERKRVEGMLEVLRPMLRPNSR